MTSFASPFQVVMPGLVPGIHAVVRVVIAWMAGTSLAMTARMMVEAL